MAYLHALGWQALSNSEISLWANEKNYENFLKAAVMRESEYDIVEGT